MGAHNGPTSCVCKCRHFSSLIMCVPVLSFVPSVSVHKNNPSLHLHLPIVYLLLMFPFCLSCLSHLSPAFFTELTHWPTAYTHSHTSSYYILPLCIIKLSFNHARALFMSPVFLLLSPLSQCYILILLTVKDIPWSMPSDTVHLQLETFTQPYLTDNREELQRLSSLWKKN